jgi:hypothetical protein
MVYSIRRQHTACPVVCMYLSYADVCSMYVCMSIRQHTPYAVQHTSAYSMPCVCMYLSYADVCSMYVCIDVCSMYVLTYALCKYVLTYALCMYVLTYALCMYVLTYALCMYVLTYALCMYVFVNIQHALILLTQCTNTCIHRAYVSIRRMLYSIRQHTPYAVQHTSAYSMP